ncbi:phenylacetate--CoA ligase family protein [Marinilabilia rubra]|uniref:AMP-binding protein n=1 Tax=Marinilabilia rubra TaxID=2162893 RepID=A0A2U2B4N5_9BACT|nr:phenylacetate--CoA ligase family protein [Marinilabilia rubra]PWD98016.1 AMP-binding protein [Marinilabilia rubra]
MDFFKVLNFVGFPVYEAQKEYADIMAKRDILAWQEEKRKDIFDYHFRENSFYRKHVNRWDGIWSHLPIITKSDLRGDYKARIPANSDHHFYVSKTSGSDGQAFVFAKDYFNHALTWVNIQDHYSRVGVTLNDLQARFYGIPSAGFPFVKEKIKDFISNRRRFSVFNLHENALKYWLHDFSKRSFVYIYGYPTLLLAFGRFLRRNSIILKEVCPTLKTCIVTSEMCSASDETFLEKNFGIPVFNEYGASEICVMGFGARRNWQASDALIYLEVVDENGSLLPEGQSGRLLCTELFNKGTPLIRYEVGDYASIKRENGHTYITDLMGRISEVMSLPSGRIVPGVTFYYAIQDVLEKREDILESRVVAKDSFNFEIQIVTDSAITHTLRKALKRVFEKYVEPGLNVSVTRVTRIDRTGAGKFKTFVKL